jgi:hypothetical protein
VLDWWVIVTDPEQIDEISKAREEVLSAKLAVGEVRWFLSFCIVGFTLV